MTRLRGQIQNCGHIASIHQMQESDHLRTGICTYKITSPYKLAVTLTSFFRTQTVVCVSQALTHRGIIVHSSNSVDELFVELLDLDDYSAFLRAPYILPRLLRQTFPPLLKVLQRYGRDALPFHWIRKPGLSHWELLREAEDVTFQDAIRIAL